MRYKGELDLCGDVVSDIAASVVDTLGDRVDVSATRIDAKRAKNSSKKYAEKGRIPSFLIFIYLFLEKRGSKC